MVRTDDALAGSRYLSVVNATKDIEITAEHPLVAHWVLEIRPIG